MSASTVRWFSSFMPGVPKITSAGTINEILKACLIDGFNEQSVNSIEVDSGGVATVTFGVAHGFLEHSWVRISGADQGALNDDWQVYDVTELTLKFQTELGVTTATGTMLARFATPSDGADKGWELLEESGSLLAIAPKLPAPLVRSVFVINNTSVTNTFTLAQARWHPMFASGNFTSLLDYTDVFGADAIPTQALNWTDRHWVIIADEKMCYIGADLGGWDGTTYSTVKDDIYGWSGFGYIIRPDGTLHEDDALTIGCGPFFTITTSSTVYRWDRWYKRPEFGRQRDGEYIRFRKSLDGLENNVNAYMYGAGSSWLGYLGPEAGEDVYLANTLIYQQSGNLLRGSLPGLYSPFNAKPFSHLHNEPQKIRSVGDKKLLFGKVAVNGGSTPTAAAGAHGTMAFDITGPWR